MIFNCYLSKAGSWCISVAEKIKENFPFPGGKRHFPGAKRQFDLECYSDQGLKGTVVNRVSLKLKN